MKIGFLGGSFDPVHHGHLLAAERAREEFGLDRVFLVPAARAPLKAGEVGASATDRLAMLQLAVAGNPRLEISEAELARGGTSYTADSVRGFRAEFPGAELFWIIGGDQVLQLPRWQEAAALAVMISFIAIERPGVVFSEAPALPGLRLHRCAGRQVEISSTEIRRRAGAGQSLHYLCPPKVVAYITEKKLYS